MKLLRIYSLLALFGKNIGNVIAYVVARSATWQEYD